MAQQTNSEKGIQFSLAKHSKRLADTGIRRSLSLSVLGIENEDQLEELYDLLESQIPPMIAQVEGQTTLEDPNSRKYAGHQKKKQGT